MDKLVAEFVAFVRRGAIPEPYVQAYATIAHQFLSAYPLIRPEELGPDEIGLFLMHAQQHGASEQQIKNARTATEALVWYLKNRTRTSLAPPPASKPPSRSEERVSFIRDVQIRDLMSCRSSDLSSGGMFVETMGQLTIGNALELSFRLEHDEAPVHVAARVVYTHPMGAGVQFLNVDPAVRKRIERYLAMARGDG